MLRRSSTGVVALAALMVVVGGAQAAGEAKYPNWKGQWDANNPRLGGQGVKFDPNKAFGPAQQAPLTPEYQKVHEESMADQAKGGQGNFIDHARCVPGGMPSMMSAPAQEYIVTPETTYISVTTDLRRIFTDGRPWPTNLEPTYQGYSIGKWIDEDGDGVYDVLEVETRGPFKGPRAYPNWSRISCAEGNNYIVVGSDVYFLSGDGFLMPTKKDQAPPDSRYFKQAPK